MNRKLTFVALLLLCSLSSLFAQTRAELLAKAEAGDAHAQLRLGQCYDGGRLSYGGSVDETERDNDKAIYWYKKAADGGEGHACFFLALKYEYEIKDKEKAIYWYKRYADYEHENDQDASLTLEYLRELGVVYDPSTKTSRSVAANSSSSSSESRTSSSSSTSSNKLLARGRYTIGEGFEMFSGQSIGPALGITIEVEFYDDYIIAWGTKCSYEKTQNGWKVYSGSGWGGSVRYYVDSNYNMKQEQTGAYGTFIIRKSNFPPNPKRNVRKSNFHIKRSVLKTKSAQHQKCNLF
ncbi:MAG: tetratricopeptide repeat protein, partial [Bacteroidaceae bacterium]